MTLKELIEQVRTGPVPKQLIKSLPWDLDIYCGPDRIVGVSKATDRVILRSEQRVVERG